jgi:hypothetical protein
MTVFLVAQPFRAVEESPEAGWTIGYDLSIHGLVMAPFRGASAPRLRKVGAGVIPAR